MPSQKFARAPLWCAVSLALGLAVSTPYADAAGLGRLTVQSGLGQPLKAELEVTAVGRDEAPSLQVKLAPLSAFRAANLDFNPALTNLRFSLDKRPDGTYFIRINSPQPVNEPYLDLMVELTWSTGRVIREYTVLLDPPSLRQQADVIAPVAPPAAVAVPAPAPARPAPAPAAAAPAPAPAAAAPAAPPAPAAAAPKPAAASTYSVKPGDTLGRIAAQNKPADVSLDQMLVAMFRQNPDAFAGGNMNRLKAGAQLNIPSDASGIAATDARREVVAQSADFAQYKSRLAQSVTSAPAPAAAPPAAAAAGGQVTARVEDKGAQPPATGDQLKIAKADEKGAGAAAAAAKADEAAAKARAVKEEQERAEQLRRTNEALRKALEVQSKAGAQAQQQADQKAPAPVAAPAAAPAEPAKAEQPKAEPAKAEAAKAEAAPPAAAPVPNAAPAAAPKADESNFVVDMLGNTTTQLGLAGIVALLAGLFGWSAYRKRKAESGDGFKDTNEGLQANSMFGATGGQSVDTGTSTFNSSFIPAASQLDSNEVDPVAEADVYIAYGREEQAEDILKEALRLQPDRNGVRLKLLEIHARRGDKAAFMAMTDELKERTGATGEDWEKALRLGRTMDPDHPLFAGAPMTELARGPATGFRLDPETNVGRPSTLTGAPTTGFDLSGLTANSALSAEPAPSAPPLTRMVVDTRMTDTEMRSLDTKMPDTVPVPAPAPAHAPVTQFRATLAGSETKNTLSSPTTSNSDFGSLDFDLGPTKMNFGPTTEMPQTKLGGLESESPAADEPKEPAVLAAPVAPASEAKQPMPASMAAAIGQIPDLDLNIPHTRNPVPPARSAPAPVAQPAMAEDALSRPTVIGLMKAPGVNTMMLSGLPEEAASRLTSNTEQATVPLIDFDLSAISIDAATKRGETEPGSALAQQMATKLDLARGYIDLGVKDGARELLDEVMRDGTREQRQAAVDLIKQIES